jgi:hypothetical protein
VWVLNMTDLDRLLAEVVPAANPPVDGDIPAEVAENVERRGLSNLPGVDIAQWQEVVKSTIAELRPLPGQHSPYPRTTVHQVAILEKQDG